MRIFLSTPSARRATWHDAAGDIGSVISIHALREEGDPGWCFFLSVVREISIHALREEGDRYSGTSGRSGCYFYPRPPRGGRHNKERESMSEKEFLSTPSARRATQDSLLLFSFAMYFYPRPPRGGRPTAPLILSTGANFYPRPPRGGRRSFSRRTLGFFRISIHALREEGDCPRSDAPITSRTFLSTPSARRATIRCPLSAQR